MMTDDDKVSRRYRELARDEPPRHVDEAILAASRRAADARPAPLVAPTGRRRWYFPLAAAAVIVLAVAVTVHVERQQRGVQTAEAPVGRQEEKTAAAQAPAEPPRAFTPDPEPQPLQESRAQRKAEVLADVQKPQVPQAAPAAPGPAAAPDASGRRDAAGEVREAPQPRAAMRSREATAGAVSGLVAPTPEQWLQGIADLKRQGRHDEAERQLAEFRKRYPDYRIPEAITEKFEKR